MDGALCQLEARYRATRLGWPILDLARLILTSTDTVLLSIVLSYSAVRPGDACGHLHAASTHDEARNGSGSFTTASGLQGRWKHAEHVATRAGAKSLQIQKRTKHATPPPRHTHNTLIIIKMK